MSPETRQSGQMWMRTVVMSGSGSALSAVRMIRKERAAPHERDSTEVTTEMTCVLLYCPVLSMINTCGNDQPQLND